MVVQSGDEQVPLTAFVDMLNQVFPDQGATSKTGLAERILDIDSVSVTYKNFSKIIQNFCVFERQTLMQLLNLPFVEMFFP